VLANQHWDIYTQPRGVSHPLPSSCLVIGETVTTAKIAKKKTSAATLMDVRHVLEVLGSALVWFMDLITVDYRDMSCDVSASPVVFR